MSHAAEKTFGLRQFPEYAKYYEKLEGSTLYALAVLGYVLELRRKG